ncbi:MAG: ABC transporter permease [Alphaproteobacteria bacterium]|nr:ABC transporter permease [Alphaproteobacteria bacterium]
MRPGGFRLGLAIAATHLASRRRQTVMSLLGVMLGVAFFLAVSALMRGSERDFIERLINSQPHVMVSDEFRLPPLQPARQLHPRAAVALSNVKPSSEVRGIRGYKQKMELIAAMPGVRVAPVLSGQVILTFAGKDHGVLMNGVVPKLMSGVSDIEDKIVAGSLEALDANPNGIIIGEALIGKLGVKMGGNVTISSPGGQIRTMKIVGLFSTGATAIDEGQAYVLLKRAQAILNRPDRANRLIMQLDDPYRAREIAAEIEQRIAYRTQSWQETSENITAVLVIRNIIMYSVVSAILVVASFGIYNVISTVVMEKRRDIAILKAIGFHTDDVRRIFLFEGMAIGAMGSVVGVGFGLVLMLILGRVEITLPGTTTLVNLPLYWGFDQMVLAAAFAILSAAGAAYFPARRAAMLQPVDILRGQT